MIKDLWASVNIPDCHIPFEDRKAYNLMLEICSFIGSPLKEIVLYGDFADFYNVTSHQKDKRVQTDFLNEVESIRARLDELDLLYPGIKKIYLEGNHEWRLERYMAERCPELFGVTDWQFLFELNKRPLWNVIEYTPYQKYKILGTEFYASHTPTPENGNPMQVLNQSKCSTTYGHVHRILRAQCSTKDGRDLIATCPGWLGDKKKRVFYYVKGFHNWQLGFQITWVDPHTKMFWPEQIEIKDDYTAYFMGKKFKG